MIDEECSHRSNALIEFVRNILFERQHREIFYHLIITNNNS